MATKRIKPSGLADRYQDLLDERYLWMPDRDSAHDKLAGMLRPSEKG